MHYPKVLERVDFPEQIFHRSFSLGAPERSDAFIRTWSLVTHRFRSVWRTREKQATIPPAHRANQMTGFAEFLRLAHREK